MKRLGQTAIQKSEPAPVTSAEACDYVADMTLELRSVCKQNDLEYLAYLLEIVFIEATEHSTRDRSALMRSTD